MQYVVSCGQNVSKTESTDPRSAALKLLSHWRKQLDSFSELITVRFGDETRFFVTAVLLEDIDAPRHSGFEICCADSVVEFVEDNVFKGRKKTRMVFRIAGG
jgi:hypothetical protein